MQALQSTGAPALVRQRRSAAAHRDSDLEGDSDDDDEDEEGLQLPLRGDALMDPYAIEPDDPSAALCAICGDGNSHEGNPIMFCERCNVPVHQLCYNVETLPDDDWLCWPCVLCASVSAGCADARC